MTSAETRPALFLDRDGVINRLVLDPRTQTQESPLAVADVALLPDVSVALTEAAASGLPMVIVSNQPAAAKGVISDGELTAVHRRVLDLLAAEGVPIAGNYLCRHHPNGVIAGLSGPCECRKPAPGLLIQAADELKLDLGRSWLVGDTDADVGAARRARLAGVAVVTTAGSAHRRTDLARSADLTAESSLIAVRDVLSRLI